MSDVQAAREAHTDGGLRRQLEAAFHPDADDWNSLFFWQTAALGQAQFGADMAVANAAHAERIAELAAALEPFMEWQQAFLKYDADTTRAYGAAFPRLTFMEWFGMIDEGDVEAAFKVAASALAAQDGADAP